MQQRLDATQPFAHSGARPDRPFEGETTALWMRRLEFLSERRQPLVRRGVIRLAPQPGAGDDGTESDEQPEPRRVDCREQLRAPEIFGATVRRNAASSSAPINCGAFTPAPCKTAVTAPSFFFGPRPPLSPPPRPSRPPAGSRSAAGGVEAGEIIRQFPVDLRIGTPNQRQTNAGFARERQGAFRRDALAAAGDEQNVFRPDGNLRFHSGGDNSSLHGGQPPAVVREMNSRSRASRFRDDPFDRLRCYAGTFTTQVARPGFSRCSVFAKPSPPQPCWTTTNRGDSFIASARGRI